MKFRTLIISIALLSSLVVGLCVVVALWNIPLPSVTVDKIISNERFFK